MGSAADCGHGATKRRREVAPFVWRDLDGHNRMAASVKDDVVPAVWFDETVPAFVLQRVPAAHDKNWILPILSVSLLILLAAAGGGDVAPALWENVRSDRLV
jgi:hypothetical protein